MQNRRSFRLFISPNILCFKSSGCHICAPSPLGCHLRAPLNEAFISAPPSIRVSSLRGKVHLEISNRSFFGQHPINPEAASKHGSDNQLEDDGKDDLEARGRLQTSTSSPDLTMGHSDSNDCGSSSLTKKPLHTVSTRVDLHSKSRPLHRAIELTDLKGILYFLDVYFCIPD